MSMGLYFFILLWCVYVTFIFHEYIKKKKKKKKVAVTYSCADVNKQQKMMSERQFFFRFCSHILSVILIYFLIWLTDILQQ